MVNRFANASGIAFMFSATAVVADVGWTDTATVEELNASIAGRYVVKLAVSKNSGGCELNGYSQISSVTVVP